MFRRKAFLHWYTGEGMTKWNSPKLNPTRTIWCLNTNNTKRPQLRMRVNLMKKRKRKWPKLAHFRSIKKFVKSSHSKPKQCPQKTKPDFTPRFFHFQEHTF